MCNAYPIWAAQLYAKGCCVAAWLSLGRLLGCSWGAAWLLWGVLGELEPNLGVFLTAKWAFWRHQNVAKV